ncbi:formate dehydrogenase accessory sulfurtransferase FdhD [Minwuia thermotolerans]|nr:formate dehydrogenase accessory sulfurtransferase FdhD [Minwuia thermotolerans]
MRLPDPSVDHLSSSSGERRGPQANPDKPADCVVRPVRRKTTIRVGSQRAPVDGIAEFPAITPIRSEARRPEGATSTVDAIAEEIPVALAYNGRQHAVMMTTPTDVEDFAIGFTLSEGIVSDTREVRRVSVGATADGIIAQISIPAATAARLSGENRNLNGRTGCGLCGVSSLRQAVRPVKPVSDRETVRLSAVRAGLAALPGQQNLNAIAHALHAAAWISGSGDVVALREDVGRHNALDKLIGAIRRPGSRAGEGFAIATSRCSYEMVHKAAAADISVLVTISAPTALALREAEAAGLCVVALARGDNLRIYTRPDRVCEDS